MSTTWKKRGVTVIEIAMAIVILSIALPPMVAAFADASIQSIHPAQAAVASFLAIERMEEVVARRYRGTDGYDALTVPTIGEFPTEAPVPDFSQFSRVVSVEYADGGLDPVGSEQGYKLVTVKVTWNGGADELVIQRAFADFQP